MSTFCKSPFATAVVDTEGHLLPCCEFILGEHKQSKIYKLNEFDLWWAKGLNDLREKMIMNEVDSACSYCIKKEQNPAIHNLRKFTNQVISKTKETLVNEYKNNNLDFPKRIEIRLGNYCNLKCTMCGPYASTSLLQEYLHNKKLYNDIGVHSNITKPSRWWEDADSYDRLIKIVSNAEFIHFSGGEPLLNPKIIDILKNVKKETEISINTNLTIFSKEIRDVLSTFKSVKIVGSVDGVESHNNYIRYNSNWSVIDKNIKQFQSMNNVYIHLYHILQHTSLYCLPPLIDYCIKNKIEIHFGEVYYGSVDGSGHLTINSAKPSTIEKFKEWLESIHNYSCYAPIHNWISSYRYNDKLNARFSVYFNTIDKIRNTNFKETFIN